MADSLGLSPMARQQLGVKSDEKFASLREYLEIKEVETKTTRESGKESDSGDIPSDRDK
jgi:hypothetical protein